MPEEEKDPQNQTINNYPSTQIYGWREEERDIDGELQRNREQTERLERQIQERRRDKSGDYSI